MNTYTENSTVPASSGFSLGPVAVVVADPAAEQEPGADELIAWCRERLAHFKCPREVHLLPELPRNATGKLLKTELRKRFTGVEGGVVQR